MWWLGGWYRRRHHSKVLASSVIQLFSEKEMAKERDRAGLDIVTHFEAVPVADSIKTSHFFPLVMPLGSVNLLWQALTVLVVLAGLVVMPYEMFVPFYGHQRPPESIFHTLDICIDTLLLTDILITFNTALFDTESDSYITDRRQIAYLYAKSWLIPDILASFPLQPLIFAFSSASARSGHITRLLRVLRLFRIVKLTRFIKLVRLFKTLYANNQWEDNPTTELCHNLTELGVLMITVLLIAHYTACIFIALAKGDGDGWSTSSWVHAYFLKEESDIFHDDIIVLDESYYSRPTEARLYIVALYWSITTLTTIGYGDVIPKTSVEMFWAMAVQFIGSCILGYIFSQVVIIFTREDQSKKIIKAKISTLNSYMRHRRLPAELKMLIRRHYIYAWKVCVFDEKVILDDLPSNIRDRIIMHLNRPVLDKIKFLASLSPQIKATLCMQLTSMQILNGDSVIVEGEVGTDAFIVKNGTLSAFIRAASTVAKSLDIHRELAVMRFTDGDIFCEYTLLHGRSTKHPYTVSADLTNHACCEILTLSHTAFRRLVLEFPILDKVFRQLAVNRLHELMDALSSRRKLRAIAKSHNVTVAPVMSSKGTWRNCFFGWRTTAPSKSIAPATKSVDSQLDEDDDEIDHPEARKCCVELGKSAHFLDPLQTLSNHTKIQAQLWAKRSVLRQALRESDETSPTQQKRRPSLSQYLDQYSSGTSKTNFASFKPPPTKKNTEDDDELVALQATVTRLADKMDSFARRQDALMRHFLLSDDDAASTLDDLFSQSPTMKEVGPKETALLGSLDEERINKKVINKSIV